MALAWGLRVSNRSGWSIVTHQFAYLARTVPSSSNSRADMMRGRGTSLSFVRIGCPKSLRLPLKSSVLEFGARSTDCFGISYTRHFSDPRSKLFTSRIAFLTCKVEFVAHIWSSVSMVKNAILSLSDVLISFLVIPTVYGRNSRLMVK